MKRNTVITMCVALVVVVFCVGGLVFGMTVDQNQQMSNVEQVPIDFVSNKTDSNQQTSNNQQTDNSLQTTNDQQTANSEQLESKEQITMNQQTTIPYEGKELAIVCDTDMDDSDLEIKLGEAVPIALNYIKDNIVNQLEEPLEVEASTITMSGIRSGSVDWNIKIDSNKENRYEITVNAQTGEVVKSSSYYRVDTESDEWAKVELESGQRVVKIEKLDLEAFTQIDVNFDYYGDVELIQGDSYGVILKYSTENNYKMSYSNQDGVLQLSDYKTRESQKQVIIDSNYNLSNYATIIVPKDAKLSEVKMKTFSGEIVVKDMGIDTLIATTTSGDCSFTNVTGNTVQADTTSGDVIIKDVNSGNLILDAISGDVHILGYEQGKINCSVTSGDTEIQCKGKETEYSYEVKAVTGSITIGNQTIAQDKWSKTKTTANYSETNQIKAKTVSGDITIGFGE